MTDRTEEIDAVLRKAHVFSLNPSERKLASSKLAQRGVKASQVAEVWRETQRSTSGEDQARGLFAGVCRDPVRFLEVVEDLEREQGRRGEPTSGMQWVCEGNPFGWSHPEHHKCNDHSRPGDWNAYRHEYNMTLEEAKEAGTTDVRRHGCSRFEVLGYGDWEKVRRIRAGKGKPGEKIQHAGVQWDQYVVDAARGNPTAAFETNNQGKVYGEDL